LFSPYNSNIVLKGRSRQTAILKLEAVK